MATWIVSFQVISKTSTCGVGGVGRHESAEEVRALMESDEPRGHGLLKLVDRSSGGIRGDSSVSCKARPLRHAFVHPLEVSIVTVASLAAREVKEGATRTGEPFLVESQQVAMGMWAQLAGAGGRFHPWPFRL